MAYCISCGQRVEDGAKHCPVCGAAIPAEQPVYVQPVPVQATPRVPVKARVLGYVGLGLGIDGLASSIIFLLLTAIYMAMAAIFYLQGEGSVGFIPVFLSLYFGFFSIPIALVGRMLCRKSMAGGNTSKACSVGEKLNIAALIVSIVMIVLGLCGFALI